MLHSVGSSELLELSDYIYSHAARTSDHTNLMLFYSRACPKEDDGQTESIGVL
jgi:hypothetical protein